MNRFLVLIWGGYLGLAPIAWLPGISPDQLYFAKLAIVALAVTTTFAFSLHKGRLSLPPGLAGPLGLAGLFFFSVFGFLQADTDLILRRTLDLVLPFTMLWSMYLLSQNLKSALYSILLSAIVVAALSGLVVLNAIFGIPGWSPPAEFQNTTSLATAGFEARRTGWSNGIALYAPLVFILPMIIWRKYRVRSLVAVSGLFAIVASQFVVGGRAGLLASLFMVVGATIYLLPRRWLIGSAAASLLIAGLVGAQAVSEAKVHLRIDRLESQSNQLSRVDHFSAGRVGAYIAALNLISDQPISGYGFGDDDTLIEGEEVHNLWLRLALEGGILLPIFFSIMVYSFVATDKRRANRNSRASAKADRGHYLLLVIVLGGGLAISFVEPRILLGSFQKSAVWWAAAGTLLRLKANDRKTLRVP